MAFGFTLIQGSSPKISKGLAALTELTRSSHPVHCLAAGLRLRFALCTTTQNPKIIKEG